MKYNKVMCIAGAVALMLAGGASSVMTTRAAEGIDPDPCPCCHTGTVWRYEEHYTLLVGTRLCQDGFTKGVDSHYENHVIVTYQCIDCDMYRLPPDDQVWGDYWVCEGYNTPPKE